MCLDVGDFEFLLFGFSSIPGNYYPQVRNVNAFSNDFFDKLSVLFSFFFWYPYNKYCALIDGVL